MAKTRKDSREGALLKGEMQRSSDNRYVYSYSVQAVVSVKRWVCGGRIWILKKV